MIQRPNEIKIEEKGDITLMDIRGDVTAFSESFLNNAYNSVRESGTRKILLNFEEEAYINSGGIALLIQILAQTKRNNQAIGITGLSEHFKKIFSMVGITKFSTIYLTPEEAVKAMSTTR